MNNKGSVKQGKITEKRKVGNLGEDISCTYLEKAGYTIKDRNYLRKYGELDIVAEKAGIIHFIEVKTVTRITPETKKGSVIHETVQTIKNQESASKSNDAYRPEDNMHPWKLSRIAKTIQVYLAEKRIGENWQFDVLTVILNMKTRRARVDFMENIIL